jgi:hypothetical protein
MVPSGGGTDIFWGVSGGLVVTVRGRSWRGWSSERRRSCRRRRPSLVMVTPAPPGRTPLTIQRLAPDLGVTPMAPYGASAATKTWSSASQTGSGASCATTWTPRLPGRPSCRSCWSRWSTCSAHTRPHPGCWAGSGMVLPDREPQPELDQCPAGPLPDRQGRFAGLGHRLVPSRLRPQFRGALAGELLNKSTGA